MCNEAEPGSLALGLTRSQSGRFTPFALRLPAGTGPLPVLGYPDTRGRCYMMNEQLSRLTPFSQQVAPGLAWRSRAHRVRREMITFNNNYDLCDLGELCG